MDKDAKAMLQNEMIDFFRYEMQEVTSNRIIKERILDKIMERIEDTEDKPSELLLLKGYELVDNSDNSKSSQIMGLLKQKMINDTIMASKSDTGFMGSVSNGTIKSSTSTEEINEEITKEEFRLIKNFLHAPKPTQNEEKDISP